jgi:hypothetical protein
LFKLRHVERPYRANNREIWGKSLRKTALDACIRVIVGASAEVGSTHRDSPRTCNQEKE